MDRAGIRELKQNASAVVARAAAGTPVTITDRGRAVALLTPVSGTPLSRLEAAGRLRPALRSLAELPDPEAGPDIESALAAMREEERY
jgi:prevent-host-death family protein